MTDLAARGYDFRVLTLDVIDEPPTPMREAMDPDKLDELRANIRENGVLSPIGVFRVGERFRIIYGHRRYTAAKLAGESAIPARVHADGEAHEEDFKLAENTYREDVNPAEEATWLADLLERKCNGEIEKLCALVRRKESWIQGRLDLLRGDEEVHNALRAGKINLAVARELNKVKDVRYRRHHLADAVEQGATAATVQAWRINTERFLALQAAERDGTLPDVAPSTESPHTATETCPLCDLDDDQHAMEYVRVHRSCHETRRRELRASRTAR